MNSGGYGGSVRPSSVTALDDAAVLAGTDPDAAIAALPWLSASLAADSRDGLFAAWGSSTVIDENVGAAVLPRGLFDALHRCAGLEASWPVGDAGLLHVYGYLLSTVPTPYGLKRERWLDGRLAVACRLSPDGFLPWTEGPTLLTRVTAAAERLLVECPVRIEEWDGMRATTAIGPVAASGVAPLAYAIAGRLVTLFPVADPGAVLDAPGPPRPRWNAVG